LGVSCLGCCWALMALGFVGGVMNLLWMGIATALMVLEKLPRIGDVITKPLGVVLLASGVFAVAKAFGV
jgi:predicted metal-binding membrane protein